jgi:hypothetical protein
MGERDEVHKNCTVRKQKGAEEAPNPVISMVGDVGFEPTHTLCNSLILISFLPSVKWPGTFGGQIAPAQRSLGP